MEKLFIKQIRNEVANLLGDQYSVDIRDVMKNNGVCLKCIVITKNDQYDMVTPSIYLDKFFDFYKNGLSVNEISRKIILLYSKRAIHGDIAFDLLDFNAIKNKIFLGLMNTKMNTNLLSTLVYRKFSDLSAYYYLEDTNEIFGDYKVNITKELMKNWNVSESELFDLAINNMKEQYEISVSRLIDIVECDLNYEKDYFEQEMYVLLANHNHSDLYGAACILIPNVLSDLANKMNSNLVLIPSSIHEWLIIPDAICKKTHLIEKTINDVNNFVLDKQEILSDHPYYYNRENDSFGNYV